MRNIKLDDTIAAISTPVGEGGIGIVRLSGSEAVKIADRMFKPKNRGKLSRFKTYTVHYGHIIDKRKRVVDEVIVTVMRGPKSYTKEDIVEVNCHGGIAPLKKILNLALDGGSRLAGPGEFTKRAFLNGRIDIAQAESVLDIIRSKTELSLRSAMNNLRGMFSEKINDIRDRLLSVLANIEASIDFSEEDISPLEKKEIIKRLLSIKKDMDKLMSAAREGRILRYGVRTVICGSPNVGKSSLMNALLKESRAIVTDIPGTTRDTLEEVLNIKGIPVVLVDTAGLADSDHPVEKEGIRRSHVSIEASDLTLLVVDYGRKLSKNDRDIIRRLKNKHNLIIVVNKNDLKKRVDMAFIRKTFLKKPIVFTSALDSSGISMLEEKIYKFIFQGKAPTADMATVSNDRQLDILRRSLRELESAIEAVREKLSMECVSIYVRSSIDAIGGITGHTVTEEALDRIFSDFCIGK